MRHQGTSRISKPLEMAASKLFHAIHGLKPTPMFLTARASWPLIASSAFLLSHIFKVTGQVWKKDKDQY